ncbi:MAG: glutamate 5-kinase, partial [Gammaproteobacteria bacterium]|nr:glutamate 5-kinase [Gammaproteobacteria bacterium]
ADPRIDSTAALVKKASAEDLGLQRMAGASSSLGRGGMLTKLSAARLAARSGTSTVIASGREPEVLHRVLQGEEIGTLLVPDREPVAARKQWLAGQLKVEGRLELDAGAVEVLRNSGRSLLAVGISASSGNFERGDVVACVDSSGSEIARGLVNYDSQEIAKIRGVASNRIEELLGYAGEPAIIHRDNLVLTG